MWKAVKVKVGKHNLDGMFDGTWLDIPNPDIELGDSINVDGNSLPIEKSTLDTRDDVLKIKVAVATSIKKEISEDGKGNKQAKG